MLRIYGKEIFADVLGRILWEVKSGADTVVVFL